MRSAGWGLAGFVVAAAVAAGGGPAVPQAVPARTQAAEATAGAAVLSEPAAWRAAPAEGVALRLQPASGPGGEPGLRLEYDFQGRGGWAAARRELDLELPPHYELRLLLRGEGPPNHLELKLVGQEGAGAPGENVWWHVRRDVEWPAEWTPLRVRKRQVTFAWGPAGGGEPGRLGAIEVTVTAGSGGSGWVEVAGLEIVPTEPPAAVTGPLRASASGEDAGHPAAAAVDGDEGTTWRPAAPGAAELVADLGGLRELGGVTLVWGGGGEDSGAAPRRFAVDLSGDGRTWTPARTVERGGARRSHLRLPDAEARLLRLRLPADSGCAPRCSLAELVVRPLAFGASENDFLVAVARESPRGTFPRGFVEAVYWTVAGVDGDPQEALVSEDGAVELGERGPSLEPMLNVEGRLVTWADVETEQSLAEGDLPIPTVTWRLGGDAPPLRLEVTTVAEGARDRSAVLVRYRLVNESSARLRGRLLLLVRPFQVNPPHQFLNVAGGAAPIRTLACAGAALHVDGVARVRLSPAPDRCGVAAFDEGPLPLDRAGAPVAASEVEDAQRLASAALAWELDLEPGEERIVVAGAPLSGDGGEPLRALVEEPSGAGAFFAAEWAARARWRQALDRLRLELPPEAGPLAALLRSSLAWALVHRDGPALQPGSRAYARSWIRDGALTGAALLRLGQGEAAAEFAEWFAGFQYPDGKVPCCVDRRGADPVPEHDSHGELIHLISEVHRYRADAAWLARLFPHVERAVDAIEALRQQRRTAEYRAAGRERFFGLLPESISHEGYSSRPVHSYWDATFAYRGLADAVTLAEAAGRPDLAATWARRRDEFRGDLLASIARTRAEAGVDYIPGSADLADFDSTSTTTMLEPGGLLPWLDRAAVDATFERYWSEFAARRDGTKEWETYTPYELRHLGAFARLALGDRRWRDRAHEALSWFRQHLRPPAWNGWAEAVHRDARAPRFLGDLPHGWVGTDYARSLLDLFAFERREGGGGKRREGGSEGGSAGPALVIGAGIPLEWIGEGSEGVTIQNLDTPWGPLAYRLWGAREGHRYEIAEGIAIPPGGLVVVAPRLVPGLVARVDGEEVALEEGGTVTLRRVPAFVDFVAGEPN